MLVKRNPVFPSIFDELLRDLAINTNNEPKFTVPAVNIVENETEFLVSLAAPGMSKKDFNIDLTDDVLTISSGKQEENEEKNDNFTRREYSYNAFKRSFTLPSDLIDSEKISASYKNGELLIKVPKKEMVVKKPKLIEVK